jgi:hypothetical protein
MNIMTSLLTAAGLGMGAGVNAYATLLVFGLLARWKPAMFESDVAQFFSSTPALVGLAVLYTIEFLADKIPAVDHIWDVVHTFIRPAAGALVAFAAVSADVPEGMKILATVIGGGAALGAHVTKASLRVASSVMTGGTANPALSAGEDLFALVNAIVAILLPWLVLVMIIFVIVAIFQIRNRQRKREAF